MSGSAPSGLPPRRSRLRLWLLISLVANALLVGLVVGAITLGPRQLGPTGMFLPRVAGELSPEGRQSLEASFRTHAPAVREAVRALIDARRELSAAVAADPLDEARVRAAFEAQRAAFEGVQAASHAPLMEVVTSLSAEDRRAVISSLNRLFRVRGGEGAEPPHAPPPHAPPAP